MSSTATAPAALTDAEVQQLAATWYRKLDVHAPLIELLPLLIEDGLEMKFPEATLHGQAEFERWYEGVIRIFFDERHTLKEVKITRVGQDVRAGVVVRWEASAWKAPAAASERIVLDAYQTWIVTRSPQTDKAVIKTYIVDKLVYADGSAKL